jgi:Photosynthesis system II assembly factor YCF48/Putative zinc-finger
MEQLPKIVQRRLPGTPKSGVHPDPDLLTAFVEKSLSDGERSQVLQHLGECSDCRDIVTLALPEIGATPSPGVERSPWLSWPVLRWGALAACVVVVGAAVTLHYEPRRSGKTSVTEATPAASATFTSESNVPKEPGEKLATKIAPPSLFPSDRDSAADGKLAKKSGKDEATVATRAGVSAPDLLDQNRKDQELTRDRLANSVPFKSADKATPALVAAAPAPSPTAKVMPQTEDRNGAVDDMPKAMRETVTVESATTAQLETSPAVAPKAKVRNETQKEVQPAGAAAGAAMAVGGRNALSAEVAQTSSGAYAKRTRTGRDASRWTLSADGVVQRSFDSGKTWQTIQVASNIVFRALAANESDIWVGGAAGALYHSSDAGQHWLQVVPVADGEPLTADIATLEFGDAQHGILTTGNHETWTTSDAGNTWQKH